MTWLQQTPWAILLLLAMTLGLAPYNPPHVWEKILMLQSGNLHDLVDWFDLLFHGTPWILLSAKGVMAIRERL